MAGCAASGAAKGEKSGIAPRNEVFASRTAWRRAECALRAAAAQKPRAAKSFAGRAARIGKG